jgi:NAD(P)H dehydrogenase (quinone)
MTLYAVTGATGHLGGLAVAELLARGVPAADVVALARTPGRAGDLGVPVRHADYAQPSTLPAALDGVEALLFVSGSEVGRRLPQHTAVVEAAKAAAVDRVVYTSLPRADVTPNPLAPEHRATEELLRDSGLTYAVLRNNFYYENYTVRMPQYLQSGEVVGLSGDAHIAAAARPDYAAAAVAALLDPPAQGSVLELNGPGFSLAELAATITTVTGTTVVYRDSTPDELAATFRAGGLDAGFAELLVAVEESTARGDLDVRTGDLERLLGRPAGTLEEALRASATAGAA